MKLLLDTHAFIWWDHAPTKLSAAALAACQDAENTLHLSLASAWEVQIKAQLGKMSLPAPLDELLLRQSRQNGMQLEAVTLPDILALASLPGHHRDPFDRILIAQATRGGFRWVTSDSQIARYEVAILW